LYRLFTHCYYVCNTSYINLFPRFRFHIICMLFIQNLYAANRRMWHSVDKGMPWNFNPNNACIEIIFRAYVRKKLPFRPVNPPVCGCSHNSFHPHTFNSGWPPGRRYDTRRFTLLQIRPPDELEITVPVIDRIHCLKEQPFPSQVFK
jgi:hypothetical protein